MALKSKHNTIKDLSLLVNRDPRLRIILCVMAIFLFINIHQISILLAITAFAIVLLYKSFYTVIYRLMVVNLFSIFMWVTLPFTTENGVYLSALYTLRITVVATVMMIFIAPMGVDKVANSLGLMKVNSKLVSILILTYRYILLLHDTIFTSITAMRLRSPHSGSFKGLRRIKAYAAVISTAIIYAIFRADRSQQAMICRGFNGKFPLTSHLRWQMADTVWLLSALTVTISLMVVFI